MNLLIKLKIALLVTSLSILSCGETNQQATNVLTIKKWDTFTLDILGPELTETSEDNPFLNYRLEVVFSHKNKTYQIPGYFAADGQAAETSAKKGKVWRVKFTPDELGDWNYKVRFKKGEDIAIHPDAQGTSIGEDGKTGTFKVVKGDFDSKDFRSQGKLTYTAGAAYQQFAESKKYFIKGGAGSPENFLAFQDFDDTYSNNPKKNFIKTYAKHVQDWKPGDPSWQNGNGKGIIGALNYLSSKGMNSIYFLTLNIKGDSEDVWMYESPKDFTRFDCSKLDQWEIVFEHAQRKGILLHLFTQETENETMLDEGKLGKHRKLYYRELIARFGHHLALIWNMGEENGVVHFSPDGQSTEERKAMFDFFQQNGRDQLVALHTLPASKQKEEVLSPLLGDKNLDAISFQIDKPNTVYQEIRKWKTLSQQANHQWITYVDEIGPYWKGVMPDSFDVMHDTIRREVLWGSLMAGAAGVEWYFGYKYPQADLNCEDWRSRDKMWEQTHHAIHFFNEYIPFQEMEAMDDILKNTDGYVRGKKGEVYLIYQPFNNEKAVLLAPELQGKAISINWYNPRKGGELISGESMTVNGEIALGASPDQDNMDWVVLVKTKQSL